MTPLLEIKNLKNTDRFGMTFHKTSQILGNCNLYKLLKPCGLIKKFKGKKLKN